MDFIKTERVWLKGHAELSERWVQDRIADDPSILGLGDLVLRDKERGDETHIIRTIEYWDIERKRYPQYDHCAVLDVLGGSREPYRRAIGVEVGWAATKAMPGIFEEARARDRGREPPRRDHYSRRAHLVAEDITSRFLNVISLFNGSVPLVAIQMAALRFEAKVGLVFTTVLDELTRGLVEEDEEVAAVTDRAYWEKRGSALFKMAHDSSHE